MLFDKQATLRIVAHMNGKTIRKEEFPIPNGISSRAFRTAMTQGPMSDHKDFPTVIDAVKRKGKYTYEVKSGTTVSLIFTWDIYQKVIYRKA